MASINKILSRITLLYYIFIVVLVVDFAYSFSTGFLEGFNAGSQNAQALVQSDPYSLLSATVWSFLTVGIYVWTLVLFVMLVVSLGKSIARKNIFNPRTVKLINRYTTIYAISLVMIFCAQFVGATNVLDFHDIISSVLSGASTIVMLLLFAQVLRIGQILKAETDLTI